MGWLELNERQRRFVEEYCVDGDGPRAAIRAGYKNGGSALQSARDRARDLLTDPSVMDAIEVRKADFAAARAITPELILHEWRQIAFADPTELIRTVVYGCRHCWGIGYEYEWTPWEYRNALHAALGHRCNKKCETGCNHRIPPDGTGGLGYRRDRAPNPDCPACQGEGIEDVRVADMRRVSPAARRLIAGVKKTKDGVEIKTRDQSEALKNLAQWVGLLIERKEVNVTQVTATLSPDDLTDEQLLAYIRTEMRQKEPLTLEATNG